jgi:PAS domain S-box-containing protein
MHRARTVTSSAQGQTARLIDENEQLRASLESSLEENALLVEERDQLRLRMRELSNELRTTYEAVSRHEDRTSMVEPVLVHQGETEEELRVALEELQVLAEELEAANTGLQHTNRELDERVEQRSRQLKEIDKALRSTEASLRAVADLVPDLVWRTDAKGQADWFNARWTALTGDTIEMAIEKGWIDAVHPLDRETTRSSWASAVEAGAPFEHEQRIRDAAGAYRWFLVRAEPLRDDYGQILHWFAAGTDIDDHRRTMEALQQSELRFRTLVEGMPQLVWRSLGGGDWTWSSTQWREYTGQSAEEARGLGWLDAFHPDDRTAAIASWTRAKGSGSLEVEGRIMQADEQRYRHFRTRALPVRGDQGCVIEWLGTSTDVDDILRLRAQQDVLVTELQHRTRNLMAVVQAVTARTLRGVSTLEQFGRCIDDRLSALARVQGLLSRRETGTRIPFDLLLREELSAHVELAPPGEKSKINLDGPEGVPLRSANVQTFALALHELATNAVKYGALSKRGGQLNIAWGVVQDEAEGPRLWVDWREEGVSGVGAADAPAEGGGYGRELIERALPYQLGARTTYDFEPDGIHCTIEVPVPMEMETGE